MVDSNAHTEQIQAAIEQGRRALAAELGRCTKSEFKDTKALLSLIEEGETMLKSIEAPENGKPRYIGQPQRQFGNELSGARAMLEQSRQDKERAGKPRY
jgi:hypothetical protein